MSKERTNCMIQTRLTPINQLGNGKMSVIEWAKVMLPQKLEGGVFYNGNGNKMAEFGGYEDAEDCVIINEKLLNQKATTEVWRRNIVEAVGNFLPAADELNKPIEVEEPEPIEVEVEVEVEEEVDCVTEIEKLIAAEKLKKAKKLLKECKDNIDKKIAKALKQQIKEMK